MPESDVRSVSPLITPAPTPTPTPLNPFTREKGASGYCMELGLAKHH